MYTYAYNIWYVCKIYICSTWGLSKIPVAFWQDRTPCASPLRALARVVFFATFNKYVPNSMVIWWYGLIWYVLRSPLRPLARPCIFDASISCSQNPNYLPRRCDWKDVFFINPHIHKYILYKNNIYIYIYWYSNNWYYMVWYENVLPYYKGNIM